MLLGVEKKRKEDDDFESRSQLTHVHESSSEFAKFLGTGGNNFDSCKDVDVVSVLPECSTSSSSTTTTADSLAAQMRMNSGIRSQQDLILPLDYDSSSSGGGGGGGAHHDNLNTPLSVFEFHQKAEQRAPQAQRVPLAPFSKPAPSKWDDAQKWIASPTSNRLARTGSHPQGGGARKVGIMGRQLSTKVVHEVPPDQNFVVCEEPDTKRIDMSQANKFLNWEADSYPVADSYAKPVLMIENSVAESAISLSRHDSSIAIQSATTFIPPPSTARSVSMRDMGTEMTPIASQEPSRTGTPITATTPIRSPSSSRPSTPGRTAPAPSPTIPHNNHVDVNQELSEKELQMKTRREIIALGTQLGKMNIAAWASKEEEDKDASTSFKTVVAEQPAKNVIETRAASWEEAEKAKYMARFKREEMKIQAWENHQKAKAEAEMRKIEVEVERIRGRAHDRLMNKLAATRHKAEEKRAEADAKRNQQAAKTEQQAEGIRRTGHIPSSFNCWGWCF
ncbi:Remorin C domain-containing protein [Citrus sinensis]|uniref:Remorin C domain-containing protein n=1 Tax=Citrus sinensis TaxID=2711 RepID=A0ACB8INY5_CITSI|nr:Remorin C domain-containing protein [Citrus sinensis]